MAAFLLPFAPLLGVDLKYRGFYTFQNGTSSENANNSVERHQCLEVTMRPSCKTFIVDLWNAEKYDNDCWLMMDMETAYNRFMYPNGALILKTKPQRASQQDFSQQQFQFKEQWCDKKVSIKLLKLDMYFDCMQAFVLIGETSFLNMTSRSWAFAAWYKSSILHR